MSDLAWPAQATTAAYAERRVDRLGNVDRLMERLSAPLQRWFTARPAGDSGRAALVAAVHECAAGARQLDDAELALAARGQRAALRREGFTAALCGRTFAMVQEAAERRLGMRHFDAQLQGGWVMLSGMVAEMGTGEGKTLTATLTACTAAFAGLPVHVITVNDYLCRRDADWMRPIYAMFGLSVGVVVSGQAPDVRRAAYACDITYCTNKDLTFDYLRDRLALGSRAGGAHRSVARLGAGASQAQPLVLRGLHFAIVDEVDSVLVDEARTPLIIAAPSDAAPQRTLHTAALALARTLQEGADFVVDEGERRVRLTAAGRDGLGATPADLPAALHGARRREAVVTQALTALHALKLDVHYLVREAKVQIVDEATGRILPDRSWEQGLHQMVELKEGCPASAEHTSIGRLTYQRFFTRYLHLAGMTGTAREIAPELWHTYGLPVVAVPPNRPNQRRDLGATLCATTAEKWQVVAQRIGALRAGGRPVLVGTRSVAASEALSAVLRAAGLPHQLLNARHDRAEAEIVSRAGQRGAVTVATNMAGRGTDIELGAGVASAGGLHVICTEMHDSGRVDRQLFGRCARQGDPGTHEAILSLDDELCRQHLGPIGRSALARAGRSGSRIRSGLVRALLRNAQRQVERHHHALRRELRRLDEQIGDSMAFSGRGE